ncbi:MAG: hypothetical protein H6733_10175 [Alphaproteobacteria bacterium]|nr:hypothetical protein [Alphaproteobacteria bacterium]
MSGRWRPDLQARVREQIGSQRAEAWGVGTSASGVDLSSNILSSVSGQLACLYDRPPRVSHPEDPAGIVADLLRGAGWDSVMQRVQRDTIALREYCLHVQVLVDTAGKAHLVLRPVAPDLVIAEADPAQPEVPVVIREAIQRAHPTTGATTWFWDVYDIRDPAHPSYRILSIDEKEDWTVPMAGAAMEGDAYPYRDRAGRPILPWVLHHASRTGCLWDAYYGIELVDGTLQAGVHYSHLAHAMVQAAHPQRWALGCSIAGDPVDPDGDGRVRHEVVTDPAAVLMLMPAEGFDGQPSVGQWSPGAEIDKMSAAIEAYERRVSAFAGVSASDLLRVSGDPRSGYALSISREGKREASKQFEAVFGVADRQLCRVVACLTNGGLGLDIPEDGYDVAYQALPLSAEERRAVLDETTTMLDRGLIDQAQAQSRLREAGLIHD